MPTDPNYFDHIVHMIDEKGRPFCNGTTGKTATQNEYKTNCNKCMFFIKNRDLLEKKRAREARAIREKKEQEK